MTPEIVTTLLASGDCVRALLGEARDGEERRIEGLADVTAALAAHARGEGRPVPPAPAGPFRPAPPPAPGPRVLYEIAFSPPANLLQRGLDPLRLLEALAELGEVIRVSTSTRALPPLATLEPERCDLAFTSWLMSRAPRADLEACFEFVDDPAAVRIDGLEMDDAPAAAPAAGSAPAPAAATPPAARARGGGADDMQSIRVTTEKVDRLIDLVSELVITQSMVAQLVNDFSPEGLGRLREAVAQMDRHSRELQERVMAVRMLPIKIVFGRFSRVVRDLAQSLGERVHLETEGEETEPDKTVIERIGDPLTHLVRNAVDHGLESPEIRGAAGKPESGRLRLTAFQQGGNIFIEISDDGRGLDRERILAKASDHGLVTAGEALTDEQVHALILHPGFSTAERVTEVSGRGVGLDVVKRNVTELGGTISITSAPGRGTTFQIELPLMLAILDGQVLRVGGEVYVLPLVTITESIRPSRGALVSVLRHGEALEMRGEVLPLIRLHRLFGVQHAVVDPTRGLVVVVEHDRRRVALILDVAGIIGIASRPAAGGLAA